MRTLLVDARSHDYGVADLGVGCTRFNLHGSLLRKQFSVDRKISFTAVFVVSGFDVAVSRKCEV